MTGFSGIDYKVEISWNNESRIWTRKFEEWSSSGGFKTLDEKGNTTDFFRQGGSYVTISADSDSMLSPDSYRVLFYAEAINLKKRFDWIIDSTNLISIPSPVFVGSPNPIVLREGEGSIAEVKINSSSADELDIKLFPVLTGSVNLRQVYS
jgi:hypothetical protein